MSWRLTVDAAKVPEISAGEIVQMAVAFEK